MSQQVLITGAAGFIGHHVVEHLLKETDWELVLLCRLSHVGNMQRLVEWHSGKIEALISCERVRIFYHDLQFPIHQELSDQIGWIDYVLHLGASTHVDRSIQDPLSFVKDNVVGTTNLLEWVRCGMLNDLDRFVYFSTDEVFGPAQEGQAFKEWDRYNSGNPYAASKAGAEEMCLAFHNTYGLPVIITHCMNVFGERQHKEKFIPMCIDKIQRGEEISIHADQTCTKPGSRFYIHARNVASAVLYILQHGVVGEKFNIVGEQEVDNLEMVQFIAKVLKKEPKYKLVDFHSSRPGHDLRYALNGRRLANMGWKQSVNFYNSLQRTIQWTLRNPQWM